ncbi:MAG: hypothetical protein K5930_12310 [Treponemataceae bacterium]|nr:hypothetical protein [Treponemataceae bacterium]
MKKSSKLFMTLCSLLCVFFMLGVIVSCGDDAPKTSGLPASGTSNGVNQTKKAANPEVINALRTSGASYEYDVDEAVFGRSTTLSFENKKVVINRSPVKSKGATGDDGTWTIFVYLCGADLESEDGAASIDMEEMLYACTDSNIKFVVQTGGANKWQKYDISSKKLQRYVITDGNITLVDEINDGNMGDKTTLQSFILWGLSNYSASKMGLIFWDHGGGSISGVCFDEKHDDSLDLIEIDEALTGVHDQLPEKFEFIGFDACLMSTIEVANMLVPHANYMIASEELEPGCGWNYLNFGEYLNKNPKCNGKELGMAIADSFYNACVDGYGTEAETTLSVTDLSKLDNLISALNTALGEMYEASADASALPIMVRNITSAKNFGGNNRTEGYTNMVDLGCILQSVESYVPSSKAALEALSDAIVYNKLGKNEKEATGLSTYYPLSVYDSSELEMFKKICVSPYYMTFVDKITYGANTGSTSDYDADEYWLGDDSSWWSDDDYESDYWGYYDDEDDFGLAFLSSFFDDDYDEYDDYDDYGYYDDEYGYYGDDDYGYYDDDDYGYYDDEDYYYDDEDEYSDSSSDGHGIYGNGFQRRSTIEYDVEPMMTEDGTYGFILTEDSMYNLDGVYCCIMLTDEDGSFIDLGLDNYVDVDWDEGIVTDNFDGLWYLLGDGQVLAMYLIEEGEDYDLYSVPAQVNGKDTNLRVMMEYSEDGYETYLLGTSSGVSNGAASGRIKPLKRDDVIIPAYYVYNGDGEYEGMMYGDEYVFNGDDIIYDGYLPASDYYYSFQIKDIYGNEYYTDYVLFGVDEEGEIYFYEE